MGFVRNDVAVVQGDDGGDLRSLRHAASKTPNCFSSNPA